MKKCGNSVVYSGPQVAAYFTVSHYFGYDFHSVCTNDMMNETCFAIYVVIDYFISIYNLLACFSRARILL